MILSGVWSDMLNKFYLSVKKSVDQILKTQIAQRSGGGMLSQRYLEKPCV